jgi:hypothetical protein
MMEEDFLQMAECAYKHIRGKDTSPASFEQFKRELTQTNSALRETVGILTTIKDICEHWNYEQRPNDLKYRNRSLVE